MFTFLIFKVKGFYRTKLSRIGPPTLLVIESGRKKSLTFLSVIAKSVCLEVSVETLFLTLKRRRTNSKS